IRSIAFLNGCGRDRHAADGDWDILRVHMAGFLFVPILNDPVGLPARRNEHRPAITGLPWKVGSRFCPPDHVARRVRIFGPAADLLRPEPCSGDAYRGGDGDDGRDPPLLAPLLLRLQPEFYVDGFHYFGHHLPGLRSQPIRGTRALMATPE